MPHVRRERAARGAARPCARRRTDRSTGAAARSSPAWARSTSKPLCSRIAHHLLALPRLVVLGAAAVEVDDLAPGRRSSCGPSPSARSAGRRTSAPARRGGPPASFSPSTRSGRKPSVKLASGATGRPGAAEPGRPGDDPVAQGQSLLALELVARLRVDLGDLHPLRADHRADPASRAVVDRRIDRRLAGDAVALGLRDRRTSAPGTAASRSRPGTGSRRSCT